MNEGIPTRKKQIAKSTCHNVSTTSYKNDSESRVGKTSSKRKLKELESIHLNVHPHISKESPQELLRESYIKRLRMSKSPCSNIITRSKSQTLNESKEVKHHKKIKIETDDQVISAHSKNVTPDKSVKVKKSEKKDDSKQFNLSTTMKRKGPAKTKVDPRKKITHSKILTADKSVKAQSKNGNKNTSKNLNFSSPTKKKGCPAVKAAPQKKVKQKQCHKIKKHSTSKSSVAEASTNIETPKPVKVTAKKKAPFEVTIQTEKCPTTSKGLVENIEFQNDVERKTDYQNLLALTDVNLVQNAERFECPICFVGVDFGKGVTLQECIHSFCRKCLVNAILVSETAVVRCPFRNNKYSCESYLQEREVKSLVTPEAYEQHLHRSVAFAESQAQNSFHCRTPQCPAWWLLDGGIVYNFACPVCNHVNCLICAAVHEGQNCEQYQNELKNEGKNYIEYKGALVNGYNIVTEEARQTADNVQEVYNTVLEIEGQSREPEVKVVKPDYHNLLALNNVNLVMNVEQFECPICFSDVNVGEGVILQECLHNFCRECLAGAIQFSETAVVQCPFRSDEYSCNSHLQEREIKSLVTQELYEKHLQRSVALAENQAQNSFHCKTPDCPGWCLFEDDVNTFHCPVCHHTNCLTCAAIHEGKNCRQYQDDLVFRCDSDEEARRTREYIEDILHKGKGIRCPQCQIILMKKEGCDWIVCSMCQTEICWRTKGPRWGPKGKGDTSGGCKCMVNGVRCDPRCRNCH